MLLVGAGATASCRLGRYPRDVAAGGTAVAVSVGGVLLVGGGVALGCRRRGGSFFLQVGGGGTFLQGGPPLAGSCRLGAAAPSCRLGAAASSSGFLQGAAA